MKLLRAGVVVGSWIVLILLGVTGAARAVLHLLPATDGGGWTVILVVPALVAVSCIFLCSRRAWKVILSGIIFILGMILLVGVIAEHNAIY